MTRTALIAGATGLTGSALLKILENAETYSKIIILTRRPSENRHLKVEEIVTDADSLSLHNTKLIADDIFCCLGTTIKKAKSRDAFKKVDLYYPLELAKLTKQNGATRFFVVSSMGANEKSKIFYSKVKGTLEKELIHIGFNALHIFRPSLLLGKRNEFRFGEYAGTILYKMLSWLFIGP